MVWIVACLAASSFVSHGGRFTVRPVDSRTYVRTLREWRKGVQQDSDAYRYSMDYVGWQFVTPQRHTCVGLYCDMELQVVAQVYEGANRSLCIHSVMTSPVHTASGRVLLDMLLQNGVHIDRKHLLPRWLLEVQHMRDCAAEEA